MRCLPKAECKLCPYSNELSVTKVIASDSMTPQAWVPVRLQLFHALFVCFHIYLDVCVYSCSHCACLFKSWHWRHYYFGLKMHLCTKIYRAAPMTEMTFPHGSYLRKTILTSFDTHCFPASFQPRAYAFILLLTETWIPRKPSQFQVK